MNDNIRLIQTGLAGLGYLGPNQSDGLWGSKTAGAVKALLDAGGKPARPLPAAPVNTLPWVREMLSVLGLHESRDKARLEAWLKSDGHALGSVTDWPWCGDAVETAIKLALPTEPLVGALGANPYWARNWLTFGRKALGFGSIGVFERGPSSGHVCFLIGQDDTSYHCLGGNQSDMISITRILKTRLLDARFPLTWDQEPVALPQRAPTDLAVSVNEA